MRAEDILDGESQFTMKLRYLTVAQRDWFNRHILKDGFLFFVIAIYLINFDNWLGYKIRGKYPLRHKVFEDGGR